MFLRISYFKKHFDSCFLVPTSLGEQENNKHSDRSNPIFFPVQ